MGVAATGKSIHWTENQSYRLKKGQIAELWSEWSYQRLWIRFKDRRASGPPDHGAWDQTGQSLGRCPGWNDDAMRSACLRWEPVEERAFFVACSAVEPLPDPDIGTFMRAVGSAWLMVSIGASPLFVVLTQERAHDSAAFVHLSDEWSGVNAESISWFSD
jgi:hypothetical protein